MEVNYVSKERGSLTPIPEGAFVIRDMVVAATGSTYGIKAALPEFPPPSHHASWYLLGNELRGPNSTMHAHTAWEDDSGNIFIRSMYLGDTTDWIGPSYGEEGAIDAMRIDYSDFNRARKMLARKFPLVEERLSRYERILGDISSKYHVALTLWCAGEMGLATFYVIAKISARDLAAEEKAKMVKLNVKALKEAWNEIDRHDSRDSQK
jgi:hypothetical protein